MIYRTTVQADLDIADLFSEGAQRFGLEQAERYENGLFETLRLLASNPMMARLRHEFRPPVRIHPYRSHIIVYAEHDAGVLILRILHGRQDWEVLLS